MLRLEYGPGSRVLAHCMPGSGICLQLQNKNGEREDTVGRREGEGRGREGKRREEEGGEGREREGRGREGGGNGREWKGREEEGENASDSFPGDERGTGLFHLTIPDCPQEQSGQRPDTD